MVAFFVPIGLMGGAAPPKLTFEDYNNVISTNGTHTHSGLTFGPASSDRALIVCAKSLSSVTSVTIGGVSASLCAQQGQTGAAIENQIWIANVPTGTTGSVVLSGPGGGTNWSSSVGVYAVTGLLSLTPTDTDTDNDFNGSTFSGIVSTTVSVNSGGFAVSSATLRSGTATSVQWTGGTQDFFSPMNSPPPLFDLGALSGAHKDSASSSVTFTTQFNAGSGIGLIGVTASFR